MKRFNESLERTIQALGAKHQLEHSALA